MLPAAVSGIVTASVVAAARAAGETAPLLFTSSIVANTVTTDPKQPMNSIPLSIFVNSESPSTHDQQQAWAAALVLIVGVLLDQQHRAHPVGPRTQPGHGRWLVPRARRGPRRIRSA